MNKQRSSTFDPEMLSQQRMAFFKLRFHSPVSKDTRCSLCSELMRDAVYTNCCGNYFCQECIVRLQNVKRPCPKCYENKFDVMVDKSARAMRAKINSLRVYCPMSKNGCKWIGPLESLEHHLKYGEAALGNGACQFLSVECPNKCGTHIPRGDVPRHLRDRCNQRTVSCPHCGFTDTHDHVTCVHYSTCSQYPVDCPNGCKMPRVQRKEVKDHMENKCLLRMVKCEFDYVGCKGEYKATDESQHMAEKTAHHLSLLSTYCCNLSAENESLRNICYQLQETCAGLQSELTSQRSTLKQTQIDLWSIKLKLPQPLPTDQGGEAPPPHSPPVPPRESRDRIYSEPNAFRAVNAQGHGENAVEKLEVSLASSGFSSLDESMVASSVFNHNKRLSVLSTSSEPPLVQSRQYDVPRTRHKSSPPASGKQGKSVHSHKVLMRSSSPMFESGSIKPTISTKPDLLPKPVIPPPVPQRPTRYAITNGRGVFNGDSASNTNKIGSSRTLPASITEELQDVFTTAETLLCSDDEDAETS